MACIEQSQVIGSSPLVPRGFIAITTTFVYALKWTLKTTIERYKSRWIVRGLLKFPDAHHDPMVTHARVASDPSLLVMLSLTMRYVPQLKQVDVKIDFF